MNDTLIIEAGRSERQYWHDLWRYRELFYVLAWRDVMIRYKQTVVGLLWAFLTPLITAIITTVVFGRWGKLPSVPGVPYFLMVYCGTLPWQFFSSALTAATQSVVGNSQLISKVYFPRLIIPAGAVVTSLADFFIALLTLFGAMAFYGEWPTWRLLFLPVFILLAFTAALGPGLLLTALTVRYRDFRFIMQFIMQIGAYVTPVYYVITIVKPWALPLYSLNPMVGVIDGFRWSVLGGKADLDPISLSLSVAINLIMVGIGVLYFRRTERTFADVI
jgi:lipopolysaccharide transport system permease protein